jgi:hypothetical protein
LQTYNYMEDGMNSCTNGKKLVIEIIIILFKVAGT